MKPKENPVKSNKNPTKTDKTQPRPANRFNSSSKPNKQKHEFFKIKERKTRAERKKKIKKNASFLLKKAFTVTHSSTQNCRERIGRHSFVFLFRLLGSVCTPGQKANGFLF